MTLQGAWGLHVATATEAKGGWLFGHGFGMNWMLIDRIWVAVPKLPMGRAFHVKKGAAMSGRFAQRPSPPTPVKASFMPAFSNLNACSPKVGSRAMRCQGRSLNEWYTPSHAAEE